jgi:hypothetical protein
MAISRHVIYSTDYDVHWIAFLAAFAEINAPASIGRELHRVTLWLTTPTSTLKSGGHTMHPFDQSSSFLDITF